MGYQVNGLKINITLDIPAADIPLLEECRQAVFEATKKSGGFTDVEMPDWTRQLGTFMATLLRQSLPGMLEMVKQMGRDGAVAMLTQMMEQVEELKSDRKANRQN